MNNRKPSRNNSPNSSSSKVNRRSSYTFSTWTGLGASSTYYPLRLSLDSATCSGRLNNDYLRTRFHSSLQQYFDEFDDQSTDSLRNSLYYNNDYWMTRLDSAREESISVSAQLDKIANAITATATNTSTVKKDATSTLDDTNDDHRLNPPDPSTEQLPVNACSPPTTKKKSNLLANFFRSFTTGKTKQHQHQKHEFTKHQQQQRQKDSRMNCSMWIRL